MTREEFLSLPAGVALGVLLDAWPSLVQALDAIPKPQAPRSPKFDQIIYRKGGATWASEYDAEGLRYWRDQKASSVESGGQYAEQDAKSVTALNYWIAWRAAFPDAVWSGERFREPVTAKAPSGKPMVYPKREQGALDTAPKERKAAPDFDGGSRDEQGGDFGDDDIPF